MTFISKPEFFALLLFLGLNTAYASSEFSNEEYENGEELYDIACANCHGKNLINPGTSSFNLKSFPRDKKDRFVKSVTEGKGFMPAMGAALDTEEIEHLWVYISNHAE